jgi:hypothetical protein
MYRKSSGVFCFTCSTSLFQAYSRRITFNPQVLTLGGLSRVDGLGEVLESLVSPLLCAATCFDVCLICTRMSGQGTLPINSLARRLLSFWAITLVHTTRVNTHTHILLVCLGVSVGVIVWESELVYSCARKILVSVSSLYLALSICLLSQIRNRFIIHGLFLKVSAWVFVKIQFQISRDQVDHFRCMFRTREFLIKTYYG